MVSPTILLLIPLLPALGALVNGIRAAANPHTHKSRAITNAIALGSTGLSALLAAWTVITYVGGGMSSAFQHAYYTWIPAGTFQVPLSLAVDNLTAALLIVVTTVGMLVHVYSIGYMAGDPGKWRFFAWFCAALGASVAAWTAA